MVIFHPQMQNTLDFSFINLQPLRNCSCLIIIIYLRTLSPVCLKTQLHIQSSLILCVNLAGPIYLVKHYSGYFHKDVFKIRLTFKLVDNWIKQIALCNMDGTQSVEGLKKTKAEVWARNSALRWPLNLNCSSSISF